MPRRRLLVWLLAMVAFVVLPVIGSTTSPVAAHALADCDHHAPPPCPEKDTAKHATGLCCPSMAGAVALLPAGGAPGPHDPSSSFAFAATPALTGLSPHQDPPPPRV